MKIHPQNFLGSEEANSIFGHGNRLVKWYGRSELINTFRQGCHVKCGENGQSVSEKTLKDYTILYKYIALWQ